MSELATSVKNLIESAIPGAIVTIEDPDGAHLSAVVVSRDFAGKSRVERHRMVYAALGDAFEKNLHALTITTQVI